MPTGNISPRTCRTKAEQVVESNPFLFAGDSVAHGFFLLMADAIGALHPCFIRKSGWITSRLGSARDGLLRYNERKKLLGSEYQCVTVEKCSAMPSAQG